MKNKFVFYCKSYENDFSRLETLVQTFEKYNCDNIKLFISIPEGDFPYFKIILSNNIILISDESFASEYLTEDDYLDKTSGYLNQEICKLVFYKSNFSENYFCLDSDSQFIRPFYYNDFMFNDYTPYTVLVQDKDLSIDKDYHNKFWVPRLVSIKNIYNCVGLNDNRYRTCHGHQTFNSKVLYSLEIDFMIPKGFSFLDLIKLEPYEFTWYNAWFQKCKIVDEVSTEPIFKTLHTRRDYLFSKLQLLKLSDFSYAYVGIVLNSKWKPKTPLKYNDPNFLYYLVNYLLTLRIWFFNDFRFNLSIYFIQPLNKILNKLRMFFIAKD
jgi:hypothetical protein